MKQMIRSDVMDEKMIARELVAVAKDLTAGGQWDNAEVAKAVSGIDMKGLGRDIKRGNAGPEEIEQIAESLTEIAEGFRDWMGS
jgi:hypothetical protein